MVDFATGFIVGCTMTAVVWTMLDDRVGKTTEVEEVPLPPVEMVTKPDNKKAAYYASTEYRNERKFIEESKK